MPAAKLKDPRGNERRDDRRRSAGRCWPGSASGPTASYRGLLSKFLPGVPVGGYPQEGVRPDDPNDRSATRTGATCAGPGCSSPG